MDSVSFRMVNDQTAEEVSATLANELDYRAQGFRVLDVGRYDSAVGAYQDAMRRPAPAPMPHDEAAAQQTYNDALLVAKNTYPDVEAEGEEGKALSGVEPDADPDAAPVNPESLTEDERRARYKRGTVDQLRQHADQRGVDLAGATTKDDIVDRLLAADDAA